MINESRLHSGILTLGGTPTTGVDMSCQITNCVIASAYSDDGNPVTTLCGDQKPAPRKLDGRKLEGTFVQDFDLESLNDGSGTGVTDYIWDHDLEVVAFSFTPNDDAAVVITGTVMLEVPGSTYGGDVNTRLTSDFSWNIQGEVTRTYATGMQSAAREPVGASA